MGQEKDMSFKELTRIWLVGKQAKLKRSTFYHYENLIRNHLDNTLGPFKLCELNNKAVCGFFSKLTGQDSSRLSNSTVKSVIYITKAVINYAVRTGLMEDPKIYYESPGKSGKREGVLSHQEEDHLIHFLMEHRTPENTGILLALLTGMRLGEVCALHWKDINLKDSFIHIQNTVSRLPCTDGVKKTSLVLEMPKSASSVRYIPIPAFLNELLKKDAAEHQKEEFIISGSCTKIPDPRTLQNKFRQDQKQAGIPTYNFHVLRHTFATRCVELGFDIKSLSEILGHASVNITLNRYVHSSMEMKKKQMLLLQQKWNLLTGTLPPMPPL